MSLKSKITTLITAANEKTGGTDATLTDAVQTLIDGYGGGGGGDSNILTFSFVPTSYSEQIRFDISDTFDVSKLMACCFSAIDFVRDDTYERAVTYAGYSAKGIVDTGYSYHIETSGSLDVNTASSFEGNYFIPSTSGGSWQEGTTYKGAVIGVLI